METISGAVGPHCTLSFGALASRLDEWSEVARQSVRRVQQDEVTVDEFPRDPALRARLEALIAAEAACCSFLRFQLDEDGDVLRLTLHHPAGFSLLPAR